MDFVDSFLGGLARLTSRSQSGVGISRHDLALFLWLNVCESWLFTLAVWLLGQLTRPQHVRTAGNAHLN